MTDNLPICGQYQLTFYANELHALAKRLGTTDWKALTLYIDASYAISAVLRKISMSNTQPSVDFTASERLTSLNWARNPS